MFNSYQNETLNRLHQEEQMQQAEASRLAANALKRTPFYAPALAQLGSTLVALGNELQAHYGELCSEMEQPTTAPQPAAPH
jgi:hypothetical protein